MNESHLKTEILTSGVTFTYEAAHFCKEIGGKGQNNVYNRPSFLKKRQEKANDWHPQELFLIGSDGYQTCVSCVSPVKERHTLEVSLDSSGELYAIFMGKDTRDYDIKIEPVLEPKYYEKTTSSGRIIKRIVSACGFDEANIWPWHDCLISSICKFCGINAVNFSSNSKDNDIISAKELSNSVSLYNDIRENLMKDISESIEVAMQDECYKEHMHIIIISGNLANKVLDLQTEIYCDIAKSIPNTAKLKSPEGIVAITAPPSDLNKLETMKMSGISVIGLNLEVFDFQSFKKICPGKYAIGREHYLNALKKSVDVFGYGNSWTNFVLGIEPLEGLISACDQLSSLGICPGANVYHNDFGSPNSWLPPSRQYTIDFFKRLSDIYNKKNMKPFYCQKALRTSLSNEAFDGRL